jgi:hypothetical protein
MYGINRGGPTDTFGPARLVVLAEVTCDALDLDRPFC